MSLDALRGLFHLVRERDDHPMNRDRLTGRHCVARKLRAQAKRRKGRVVKGVRRRAGRPVFEP